MSLSTESKIEELVSCYLYTPKSRDTIIVPQFQHRLQLMKEWSPKEGERILDVGCGQGECTLTLAQAVGPTGSVLGIDPGSPTYGGPYTIGQAQEYIKKSSLGDRIDFKRADAPTLLQDPATEHNFQAAAMCHSLWYFTNPESIQSLFQNLKAANIQRVFLAEHSFTASNLAQIPHVLAAQAQKRLHQLHTPKAYDGDHERNVRTASSPEELLKLAEAAGWGVASQGTFTPVTGLMDGHWESMYVLTEKFASDVGKEILDDTKQEVLDFIPRVKEAIEKAKESGAERMQSMDTWWAVLEVK